MPKFLAYEFAKPSEYALEDVRVPIKLTVNSIFFKSGGKWAEPVDDPPYTDYRLYGNLYPAKFGYAMVHKRQKSLLWLTVSYIGPTVLVNCLWGETKIPFLDGFNLETNGTQEPDGIRLSIGQYTLFYQGPKPAIGDKSTGFLDRPPFEGPNGLTFDIILNPYLYAPIKGPFIIGTGVGPTKTLYFRGSEAVVAKEIRDWWMSKGIFAFLAQLVGFATYFSLELRDYPPGPNPTIFKDGYHVNAGGIGPTGGSGFYFDDACFGYANPTWFSPNLIYKSIIGHEDESYFFGGCAVYPALAGSSQPFLAEGAFWMKLQIDVENKYWKGERAFWISPIGKDNSVGNQSGSSYSFATMHLVHTQLAPRNWSKKWNGSWVDYTPSSAGAYEDPYWGIDAEFTLPGLGKVEFTSAVKTLIIGDKASGTPQIWIAGADGGLQYHALGMKEIDREYGNVHKGVKYGLVTVDAAKVVAS